MHPVFILSATYELLLEVGNATRPFRIEVFRSVQNEKVLRARVWEQTTYNLYPTFANIYEGEGFQNRLMSCDEVSREVTTLVADTVEFVTGKEWESVEAFLAHAQELVCAYRDLLNETDNSKGGGQ